MTRYLLDTNIFIQAKNLHYGFDFCPAFWEWLTDRNAGGRVARRAIGSGARQAGHGRT